MARLAKNEVGQIKAASAEKPRPGVRWPVRPMPEYVAFATFAARFIPPTAVKPMMKGANWKL